MHGRENDRERHNQLARVDALLNQWAAWKRKQTATKPAFTREYLQRWRQQLLDEQEVPAG
jgi:hypothetical protein